MRQLVTYWLDILEKAKRRAAMELFSDIVVIEMETLKRNESENGTGREVLPYGGALQNWMHLVLSCSEMGKGRCGVL